MVVSTVGLWKEDIDTLVVATTEEEVKDVTEEVGTVEIDEDALVLIL